MDQSSINNSGNRVQNPNNGSSSNNNNTGFTSVTLRDVRIVRNSCTRIILLNAIGNNPDLEIRRYTLRSSDHGLTTVI